MWWWGAREGAVSAERVVGAGPAERGVGAGAAERTVGAQPAAGAEGAGHEDALDPDCGRAARAVESERAHVGQAVADLRVLRNRGYVREALAAAEKACARWPGQRALTAVRADLCARLGRTMEARELVAEVLAADPVHAGALAVRGDLATAARKWEAAVEAYRAAAWAPGALKWAPHVMRKLARALERCGRVDEALGALAQGLAANAGEVSLAVERAWVLARAGRTDEARGAAEALASAHAGETRVRALVLEMRARARTVEEATREVEGALTTTAGRADPQLWAVRARRMAEAGAWAEAARSWLAVHALVPRDGAPETTSFARQQAGFAFKKAGALADAAECLEPEFLLDPTNVFVRGCLLSCLLDNGEMQHAVELVERALAQNPEVRALLGVRRKLLGRVAR